MEEIYNRYIKIADIKCYKCKKDMKLAYMVINENGDDSGYVVHPDEFTKEELLLVRNKGVFIEKVYSQTIKKLYFANICPHCNSFIGDHYIHNYYGCARETIISPIKADMD